MTIKPIAGSWFEFQHFFDVEGKYWNDTCKNFTSHQWRTKIAEMRDIGLQYLVLQTIANNGYAYYKTPLFSLFDFACEDPLDVFLREAERLEMKVFVSNGYFTPVNSPIALVNRPDQVKRRLQAMNEIASRYGHHGSFHGWYFPHEAYINRYFTDGFIEYVNVCSAEGRRLLPESKILVAPYGIRTAVADALFVKQLESMDVDIVAYQDGVGVKWTELDRCGQYYEILRNAHDRAGRSALWADVEIFDFEGEVYKSALIPASFDRVEKQIREISPFVDRILVYEYLGMMNRPGSEAFAGHPESVCLYTDYRRWLEKNAPAAAAPTMRTKSFDVWLE